MTDLLKDTLTERAAGTEPPDLDLDAIISTGDRRIRRRRTLAVAGTALVTLAVVVTGLTLTKPGDEQQPAPVAKPFTERRATYAIGSEIHFGADVISVAPDKVSAFVQTDAGFVFAATGKSGVFLADGKQVRRIGTDDGPGELAPLTVSTDGSMIGWTNWSEKHETVVYDVVADREVLRTAFGNKGLPTASSIRSPYVIAIDGDYAYLGTLGDNYRWNLKTGAHEKVSNGGAVRTVSAGQYLYQRPLVHPTGGTSLAVGGVPSDSAGTPFPGNEGYLSPTAKYLLTATKDPQRIKPSPVGLRLFETATGKDLPFTHTGHPRLIFSQWLSDETFTAAGSSQAPNSAVDLLTCSTRTLSCETTVPAFSTLTFRKDPARIPPFALPIGTPIFWLFG